MLNKYKGSTKDLYVWNDMNEFSVFNGPEVSNCCLCPFASCKLWAVCRTPWVPVPRLQLVVMSRLAMVCQNEGSKACHAGPDRHALTA